MKRGLWLLVAMLCAGNASANSEQYRIMDSGLPVSGGPVTGKISPASGVELTGAGTCVGADSVLADNNGNVGCPKISDTAPQGLLIRCQPSFAGGAQNACNAVVAGGMDELKIAIDGSDPSVTCAGANDTVTVTTLDSNGATAQTILTGDVNWTVTSSVATTCANLATAVTAIAGSLVSATCTSPNVLIVPAPTTADVTLQESTAACTTVSTGTRGKVKLPSTQFIEFGDLGGIAGYGLDGAIVIQNHAATAGLALNTTTTASLINAIGSSGSSLYFRSYSTNGTFNFQDTNGAQNGVLNAPELTAGKEPLTAGLMSDNIKSAGGISGGALRRGIAKYTWTNAQVTALGAALTGDIAVATLPARTVVARALVVINTAAAGVSTLTVAVGTVGAAYINYVVASDAKAAANTVYGDAFSEIGTSLKNAGAADAQVDHMPTYTGTTLVNAHFISTGSNLDQVTTSTGTVYIEYYILP